MSQEGFKDLRRKAMEQLTDGESRIQGMERVDLEKMAQELAVHQIELEIQNEELSQTRLEAETIRDRYIDLYDFAPVGYFTIDRHSHIIEANLTGSQMLKMNRIDLIKQSFTRFIDPAEGERFYLQRRKVLEKGAREKGELKMLATDGTPFYAQIESLKVGNEQLRLAVMDVSERRKAEELLAQQKSELEAALKELESFSYSVSHDLKTPLRSLDGFSQALLEDYSDKLDDKGKEYLNLIRAASQLMAALIEDLLKLSRLGRAEMYLARVNLSELAESIIDGFKTSQPPRLAEFIIGPDLIVEGDKPLLTAALRNLLENAWKFSSKSSKTRIELGVTQKDSERVYFIKDNGAGFDMRYQDKLFQPFQRLHSVKEYPGTGIGLAIVQRVISRHGGKIWAEAEVGKGATFYFTLD